MKLKKIITVLLSGAMLLTTLSGCSSDKAKDTSASDDSKVTIKLFTGKIETIDVMNEIINDFNASQDRINVVQEYQNDASNIIKIKFASDEVPDIMTTYEQGFVDEGKYLDLSAQTEWWERLSPEMKESCTDIKTGKQYRVCTNMTMAGYYYNKEIFDELNLSVPDTWDEFVVVLEKIKTEKPDVAPWFVFGSEAWHLGHLIEFIPHGYIKSTLGTIDAKKAMLDNDSDLLRFGAKDGAMAVFGEKMLELQEKGLLNEDILTATSDNCVQDFVNGKAAMFSNGMWIISSLLEANPDIENSIGFAPFPSYMPDSESVVLSSEDSGYAVSATSEHKEEALEFLDFLFQPENQKKYSEAAKAPSAFSDVDADWAPQGIITQVNEALAKAVNIGFTNEKPAGFSGDDAGRLLQELFVHQYDAYSFAETYEKEWNAGMNATEE